MSDVHRYIHAFGPSFLTRFYDPMIKLLREDRFKSRMIDLLEVEAGHRVLDVGCGTGTLGLMIEARQPGAKVYGIDGDSKVLSIARTKAARRRSSVQFERAMAWDLPYPEASFDRVVSSLVFHHLASPDKLRAAQEIHRVLRPGGIFLLADFGPPESGLGKVLSRGLHWFEEVSDNLAGRLPGLLSEAGFSNVEEVDRARTLIGPIAHIRAYKPQ